MLLPGEKPLLLAPLSRKVQWDAKRKEPSAASESEASAFTRMIEERPRHKERVRITGPLRRTEEGEVFLEARDFSWVKPKPVARAKR